MQSRFRTGMTLAMFSLVVFTIVTMSFITKSVGTIYEDTRRLSGGFDVRADAGYTAPIPDMEEALRHAKDIKEEDISAVGGISGLSIEAKQEGTDREPKDPMCRGSTRTTPIAPSTASIPATHKIIGRASVKDVRPVGHDSVGSNWVYGRCGRETIRGKGRAPCRM